MKLQRHVLAEKFGNTHFRSFQKQAIDAALNKKNVLIIQPTGMGKSLCYQFPAVYTGKATVVVTPTISLMHDQTQELTKQGINAVFWDQLRLMQMQIQRHSVNTILLQLFSLAQSGYLEGKKTWKK